MQAGGCRVAAGDVEIGLDAEEQVAFVHFLPLLDRELDDFSGDFRADLDVGDRLDLAVGNDDLGDVALLRQSHLYFNRFFPLQVAVVKEGADDGKQRQRTKSVKNLTFFLRFILMNYFLLMGRSAQIQVSC